MKGQSSGRCSEREEKLLSCVPFAPGCAGVRAARLPTRLQVYSLSLPGLASTTGREPQGAHLWSISAWRTAGVRGALAEWRTWSPVSRSRVSGGRGLVALGDMDARTDRQ